MVLAGSQPGNGSSRLLVGKTQTREGVKGKKSAMSRSSQVGLVPGVKISASRAIGKAGEIVRDKSRTAMKSGGRKHENNVLKKSALQQEVADAALYQPIPASSSGSDCECESPRGSRSGSEITSDSYNESASGSRSDSASNNESASASGGKSGSDSHNESVSGSRTGRGSDTDSDDSTSSSSSASKEDKDIDI